MVAAQNLSTFVEERKSRLVEIVQDLVRIPSENRAPDGAERECQEYIAEHLRHINWSPLLYSPDDAPGIQSHPLFWPGRNYGDRPNLIATRTGNGDGRSLILSGHIDTVPAGSASWKHSPFSGQIEGNRLYGRGSCDMKAGVASNLFVLEALAEMGISLAGDLSFETVVDEEFGGVNGTLAGRLMGHTADAAIISEPTFNRICPAQRGGRTVDILFSVPNEGILSVAPGIGVIEQLRLFLNALPEFVQLRRDAAPAHPMYTHLENPVPVTVARIQTAPWGTSEPPNVPPVCQLELFWQTLPGESREEIDRQFAEWWDRFLTINSSAFPVLPSISYPIRWLAGSSMDTGLLQEQFEKNAEIVMGRPAQVCGIEGPCDMYVFHDFGIPALLWGPRGGNTHMPNEYVEIDSLVDSTKTLLSFVCEWCGVTSR